MLYIPQPKEVDYRFNSLLEKLEINLQFDKAKLLSDLFKRLKTIFHNKPHLTDFLYNVIYIILQLAHSPLQTTLDLEMLRERFEERYVRIESNKIVRNMKYEYQDIVIQPSITFDKVNYDSESSNYTEDDEIINENNKQLEENKQHIAPLSKILSKKIYNEPFKEKEIALIQVGNKYSYKSNLDPFDKLSLYKTFNKCFIDRNTNDKSNNNLLLLKHHFKMNTRSNIEKIQKLTNEYYRLFKNNVNVKNCVVLEIFEDNYPYIDTIKTENIGKANLITPKKSLFSINNEVLYYSFDGSNNKKLIVDSDYFLSIILTQLTTLDDNYNERENSFLSKFSNFVCLDIHIEVLVNVLSFFSKIKDDLNLLRQISMIFERHSIASIMIEKYIYIIKEVLSLHDKLIDSFIKILNYQKGKIDSNYCDIVFIKNNNKEKFIFIDLIIIEHNKYIAKYLTNNGAKLNKFSLLNFFFHYKQNISHKIKHLIKLSESILTIKENLTSLNKFSNSLLNKEILDLVYNYTKSKINFLNKKDYIFYIEIFFSLVETNIEIIYEFIINGNLVDIYNESFIDHIITRKDNKKTIFYFNEKFQKFDWVDSFKIKSFSYNGNDCACVPLIFMIDNIHFKILETSKSTFLLKNLENYEKINFEFLLNQDNIDLKNVNEIVRRYLKEELNLDNVKKDIEKKVEDSIDNSYDKTKLQILHEKINENKEKTVQITNNMPFTLNNDKQYKLNLIGKYDGVIDNTLYQSEKKEKNCDNNINNRKTRISYFRNSQGTLEENTDITALQKLINNEIKLVNTNNKHIQFSSYNLDQMVKELILSRISIINQVINRKLLNFLMTQENITNHFDLLFGISFFKASFSMNKFIIELNEFLIQGFHIDKFYIKNLLVDLSANHEMKKYKNMINDYILVKFTENEKPIQQILTSKEDFITIEYQPPLPINIFFDNSINSNYNLIFNFLIKLKLNCSSIRNIDIDKKIKNLEGCLKLYNNPNTTIKILKCFINTRLIILDSIYNLEFYIFYSIIDFKINKFYKKIENLNSIDLFINTHVKLIKEIVYYLGIKDDHMSKYLYKLYNLISNFINLLNKFILIENHSRKDSYEIRKEKMENIYLGVFNYSEKYKRNLKRFQEILAKYKEKLNIN